MEKETRIEKKKKEEGRGALFWRVKATPRDLFRRLAALISAVSEAFAEAVWKEEGREEKRFLRGAVFVAVFPAVLLFFAVTGLARFPMGARPVGFALLGALGGRGHLRIPFVGEKSASALEKNLSGYARYLTSHEEGQASLRKQMIDRIGKGGSFNTETAYQIALSSGLTDENAKVVASLGVAAAKEKATSRLLEMILEQRLLAYRAMAYAREMGFNEDEVQKFGEYAKQINSTQIPGKLPSDLIN